MLAVLQKREIGSKTRLWLYCCSLEEKLQKSKSKVKNFEDQVSELKGELVKNTSEVDNRNYFLFMKLSWPGDSKGTFRFSIQAATCPPVYDTRWRLHTVSLIAEHQAGKL